DSDVYLLAGADAVVQPLAVLQAPAAAFIERKGGIDEVFVLGQKPRHAIVRAGLLVRGEGDDDVAARNPSFLLVADQVGDPDGGHGLVVAGAAAVKVA